MRSLQQVSDTSEDEDVKESDSAGPMTLSEKQLQQLVELKALEVRLIDAYGRRKGEESFTWSIVDF